MLSKVFLVLGWCFASSNPAMAEERANFQVTCDGNVRVEPPPGGAVEIGSMKLNTNGTIQSEQMTQLVDAVASMSKQMQQQSEQMNAVIANNTALTAEVAALKEDKVSLRSELDALAGTVATLMDGVKNLTAAAAEAEEVKNNATNALSNVVYGNDYHLGGTLDFTPRSTSLAFLEQTLVGVKVFLTSVTIKGTGIQGSVVSRLLKDATSIGGSLYCNSNEASFAVGDAELVFASLAIVKEISMDDNYDESKQRFTGASFPALTFVPGAVQLNNNPMLKTISMPELVGVGNTAHFSSNAALASLQLPSLITVGNDFHIGNNPSLATDKVQVSQDFESVGSYFHAFNMITGFECTPENGLRAVVAAASGTSFSNVATCKK